MKDLAERAVATFVQAFLAVVLVGGFAWNDRQAWLTALAAGAFAVAKWGAGWSRAVLARKDDDEWDEDDPDGWEAEITDEALIP